MLRATRNNLYGLSIGLILGGLATGITTYLGLGIAAGLLGIVLEVLTSGRGL